MFDKSFKFESDGTDKSFVLDLKIDSMWRNSKRRLLIIQQTVTGEDLKARELVSNAWLPNAVKYARQVAKTINDGQVKDFAFATSNFNTRRHLHLKGPARAEAESEFRARQLRIIKKLDPTHILFCGDLNLLYATPYAMFKNGWVHELDGRKVVSTLDFERLVAKQGAMANLLGFWCRHLANLMVGRNPYQVDFETKPIYVDTIEKFDKVMTKFDAAERIAVDTETRNLSVLKNAIYTIQFAFENDKDRGYVIPIDHPHEENPFSEKQRKYIKKELAKRFGKRYKLYGKKMLLTFNGAFDLRVIRMALNIPIIYLPVYEIMAGEHSLDENSSLLRAAGVHYGKNMGPNGLAAVLCSYGNDFYFRDDSTFKKEDRATTGSISPADKGFLKYGATDVVSLHHIREAQIKRASHQELNGKPYTPFFLRHLMHQMSDTVHQLSHLKESGSMIDRKYLKSLMKPDSKLVKAIAELLDEFKTFPEVKKANKEVLAESGFKTGSLFGGAAAAATQWVFSFNKTPHKAKLFFDIIGLKPLGKTQSGADAIDKEFIENYKDRNFVVAKYGEYQAATKLLGTYVKGWYKRLTREVDGTTDSHLRADFMFHNVDTGRLASANPNFQNIATRGPLAKIIKEMFVTEDGRLLIRFDYSAHEVRGWSIMSGDKSLAAAFQAGQKLRQEWVKLHPKSLKFKFPLADDVLTQMEKAVKADSTVPTKIILDKEKGTKVRVTRKEAKRILECHRVAVALKKEGDVHIQNVYRFFKKWVDKSDPLRDAIKAVVFGVLYGKSAKTLGHDTKKAEIDAIRAKMNVATKAIAAAEEKRDKKEQAKQQKVLEGLESDYERLIEDDRTEYAQGIIDKMFTEFKRGKQWVDKMVELAQSKYYVFSPIGRLRRLYAVLLNDRTITSRQIRRGMNAPGQGFASEVAVKGSRIVNVAYYDDQERLKDMLKLDGDYRLKFNRIVHDASYFSVPWEMVIPFIHILQYQSTYGIAKAYEDEFGLKFTVEPEIELEVGVRDTSSHKWNWAIPQLLDSIDKAVKQGVETGMYKSKTHPEIMETILAPWKSKKCRAYLNETYPILGVDLDEEIAEAVEDFTTTKP